VSAGVEAGELRDFLRETLPKAAHKKIDTIVEWFSAEAASVAQVDVVGGRVEVEEVEAYGLRIGVDACGNAVTVTFPYPGGEIAETWGRG